MEACRSTGNNGSACAVERSGEKRRCYGGTRYVGGLSGAFIPVSEDQGMIDAVNLGALTLEKLEAMTCVCSVGLDMIAIPGDTKASTIAGIIADEIGNRYDQSEDNSCQTDSGDW